MRISDWSSDVCSSDLDFDEWEAQGAAGWSGRHVLPYFKRAESWIGGADEYRGGDGPLATHAGNGMRNPLYRAFVDAGVEAGYGATADYNGARQEGFGALHMTVQDGVRWSPANAYLKPALQRPHLPHITPPLTHRTTRPAPPTPGGDPSAGPPTATPAT